MKSRAIIIGLLVVLSLMLAGCDELPFLGHAYKVGAPADKGQKDAGPAEPQEPEEEEFFGGNRSGGVPDGKGGDSGNDAGNNGERPASGQYEQETKTKSYCGDGVCDADEKCDRCEKDCACEEDAICHEGKCKVPECVTDKDCEDGDGCTPDECLFAGHPNAFCSTERITERRHNDGCCPPGAYVDVDSDCVPVCGDGRCDYGENERICLEDCEHFGEHGGGEESSGGEEEYWEEYT